MELRRPSSVADARRAALVIAGGTEVVPLLRAGLLHADTLVDVRDVVPRGIEGTRDRRGCDARRARSATRRSRTCCARRAGWQRARSCATWARSAGNLLQATRCWYWRLNWPCRLHGGDECFAREGEHREHAIFANDFCASAHPSDVAAALLALDARLRRPRASSRSRSSTACRPRTTARIDDARRGELILDVDVRAVRRERLPEGDGPEALGVPARRRRRRAPRRRDARRARGCGADPVAPRRARSMTRHRCPRNRVQGRDRARARPPRARTAPSAREARSSCCRRRRARRGCGGQMPRRRSLGADRGSADGCIAVTDAEDRRRGTRRSRRRRSTRRRRTTSRSTTNCGSFTVRLAVKTSPHTSASFVSLVQRGFFDKTVFHRIVPGFVIQGGDPTATGTGGPGYETVDKPPKTPQYTHGVVAMAKSADRAGRRERQPVLRRHRPNAQLPPQYALLGIVTNGPRGRRSHRQARQSRSEQPTQVVEIVHAFVTINVTRRSRRARGRRGDTLRRRRSSASCCRDVLARLAADEPSTTIVVVEGAHALDDVDARIVHARRLGARPGRVAALRARCARRRRDARARRARRRPGARPARRRRVCSRTATTAPCSPRPTTARATIRCCSRATSGIASRTRAAARSTRCSSTAPTCARRATSTFARAGTAGGSVVTVSMWTLIHTPLNNGSKIFACCPDERTAQAAPPRPACPATSSARERCRASLATARGT